MVAAAAAFIDDRRLIAPGDHVLVGVSGGCDSVALLGVLRTLAGRDGRRYRLTVAHLNHCLREGADADEQFVADMSRQWDIPCITDRRDAASEAKRIGGGVEQAARKLRYGFFRETADRVGAARVAVAHHADDNVETILHHILRGTHIRGLTGIPATRPLGRGGAMLVRPLLPLRRTEIQAYCRRNDLQWVTDETNRDTTYRRNFLRRELLPLLRDRINTRVDDALLRLGSAAGEVEDFISHQGAEAAGRAILAANGRRVVLDAKQLAREHPVLLAYVFRQVLEKLGVAMRRIDSGRLGELGELVSGKGPAAVALSGGFIARRQRGQIVIEVPAEPVAMGIVPLECPGRCDLGDGRQIVCETAPLEKQAFARHRRTNPPGVEMLDADQVNGPLIARPRRDGDAFVPLGAPGRQSVSNFLTNCKLPIALRERVICICDGSGIVYLAPLRIDDRLRVTDATRRVLRIELVGW